MNVKSIKDLLKEYKTEAKVISVYDGDTVDAIFPLNDNEYKWKIRLYGINTPEIKTKDLTIKEKGIAARNYLSELILDKQVLLDCKGLDKYGRVLAIIYLDELDLCQELLSKNFAVVQNK